MSVHAKALAVTGAIGLLLGILDGVGTAMATETTLAHWTFGTGPGKVLVLHDWMGNSQNYRPLTSYLDGEAYTYVFADLRGYGGSKDMAGAHTVSEAAADVEALATTLGWTKYSLVGHSMSGMVAQRIAIDDAVSGRHQLSAMVLITPVPASGVRFDAETTGFVRAVIHNAELTVQYAAAVSGGQATIGFARNMAKRQIEENDAAAMNDYATMWMETDFSDEAKAAKPATPILVIGGRLDLPPYQEDALRATVGAWYPNVEFTFAADAGHYVMLQEPVFTASAIERFLGTPR